MQGLPQEMQYKPTPQFVAAVQSLNKGLVEAQERAQKPITAQSALVEVTIPLFNLLSNYIQLSQRDTYGYFYGLCGFLYNQQQQAAEDNIVLAVDPDLAEEIAGVVSAARETIDKTKAYIRKVQEYLAENKPSKDAGEENMELWQGLREDALRVLSLLQESHEDLGAMGDNVDSATYEGDAEEEGEEVEDEVALPGSETEEEDDDDDEYESIVG